MWRRQGARTAALGLRTPAPIFSSVLLTRPDFAVSTSTDLGRLRLTFDRLYRRSGAEHFSAARSLCTQASSQHTTPNTTKDDAPDQKDEKNQQHTENELPEIEEFLTEEGYNEDGKKLLFTGKLFSPVQKLKIFSFSSLMLSITLTPPFIMWQTNLTDGAAKGVTFAGVIFSALSTLLVRQGTKNYVVRLWLHRCRTKVTFETLSIVGRCKPFTVPISQLVPGGAPFANLAVKSADGDPMKMRYFNVDATMSKKVMGRLLGVSPDLLDDALNIKYVPPAPPKHDATLVEVPVAVETAPLPQHPVKS